MWKHCRELIISTIILRLYSSKSRGWGNIFSLIIRISKSIYIFLFCCNFSSGKSLEGIYSSNNNRFSYNFARSLFFPVCISFRLNIYAHMKTSSINLSRQNRFWSTMKVFLHRWFMSTIQYLIMSLQNLLPFLFQTSE